MSTVCSKCGFNNESESKFCKNCGNPLSEVSFEIKETLKKTIVSSIICVSIFVFFMILGNIAIFIQIGMVQGFIGMAIIWPITLILIIWITCYLSGGSKGRRFVISHEFILIEIPKRDLFQIFWTQFNSIEIYRRISTNIVNAQTIHYNLIFKMRGIVKSFEIESGREFSRKAIKRIRTKLEEISNNKGIKYIYYKKPPS